MMPQREDSQINYQQVDPTYGAYGGNQRSSTYWSDETSSEQARYGGERVDKVYPHAQNNANVLRFILAMVSLGLLLVFGLIFLMVIGGQQAGLVLPLLVSRSSL